MGVLGLPGLRERLWAGLKAGQEAGEGNQLFPHRRHPGAQPIQSWRGSSEPSGKLSLFNLTIPHLLSSSAQLTGLSSLIPKRNIFVYQKFPFAKKLPLTAFSLG